MPGWDKLATTKLWMEEQRKGHRQILKGESKPAVVQQEQIMTDEGDFLEQEVVLPMGVRKNVCCGGWMALLNTQPINVLWLEVDDATEATPWMLKEFGQRRDMHGLVTGTSEAVHKTLQAGMEAGVFVKCAVSSVALYLSDDPALGPKEPYESNVERRALLVTRLDYGNQVEHINYIAMQTRWRPSLTSRLLDLLGLDKTGCYTVAYVPSSKRKDEDVVNMVAWLNACIPHAIFHFQLPKGQMHHAMVKKALAEGIDRHHGEQEQVIRESQVMEDGLTVQKSELLKTKKDIVEERKQALRNAQLSAKEELKEEDAQAALQLATAFDVAAGSQTLLPFARAQSNTSAESTSSTPPSRRPTGDQTPKKYPERPKKDTKHERTRVAEVKRKAAELESDKGPASEAAGKRAKAVAAVAVMNKKAVEPPAPPRKVSPKHGGKTVPMTEPVPEPRPVEEMTMDVSSSSGDEIEEDTDGEMSVPEA